MAHLSFHGGVITSSWRHIHARANCRHYSSPLSRTYATRRTYNEGVMSNFQRHAGVQRKSALYHAICRLMCSATFVSRRRHPKTVTGLDDARLRYRWMPLLRLKGIFLRRQLCPFIPGVIRLFADISHADKYNEIFPPLHGFSGRAYSLSVSCKRNAYLVPASRQNCTEVVIGEISPENTADKLRGSTHHTNVDVASLY